MNVPRAETWRVLRTACLTTGALMRDVILDLDRKYTRNKGIKSHVEPASLTIKAVLGGQFLRPHRVERRGGRRPGRGSSLTYQTPRERGGGAAGVQWGRRVEVP